MTRRLALLVNPASGRGRNAAAAPAVADRLRAGGFQVTAMQGKDSNDAADLARAVVHDGYDALVVMGGDGAVHLGTHTTHPAYEHHRVKQVSVAAPGIVAYADGERLGPLPLTIDVVPSAVTVFAPAS